MEKDEVNMILSIKKKYHGDICNSVNNKNEEKKKNQRTVFNVKNLWERNGTHQNGL